MRLIGFKYVFPNGVIETEPKYVKECQTAFQAVKLTDTRLNSLVT